MYAFTVSKMFSAQIPPKWCISATISTKYTDIRKGAVAEARLHAFGLSRDRVLKEGTLAGTDLLRISGTILRWIDKGDEMENKRCYKRDNYRYKHYNWPRRKTKQKQKNVEVILRYLLPPFSTTNQRNITFPPTLSKQMFELGGTTALHGLLARVHKRTKQQYVCVCSPCAIIRSLALLNAVESRRAVWLQRERKEQSTY